ncbi:DUF7305 domain-containing protein [Cerasicoccus fimbriatus]|uniref:DUF7305 domain-containing protein n=1 Tax=Cerasicoccus fimbriatus TaxID=3014554 RepID=UPI0022B4B157|nr:hypothetical protein [Cerasicoccus sp. TK19100]
MKSNLPSRRGSVILLAMIFSAVAILSITFLSRSLISQHQTTVRYGLGYSAFHLAESGIELGMHAIANEGLGSGSWPKTADLTWEYQDTSPVGQYGSTTKVRIVEQGGGEYLITSLASIDLGKNPVERAVETRVKQAVTQEQADENTGSGVFAYGMVARDSIKLNHNNPGMKISSYDSNVNNGVPIWGVNTGRYVTVATPSANYGAIQVNNAVVHGSIRTGGGNITYSSGFNNPNQQAQNATIIGPDSSQTSGVDSNYISKDFDGEIPNPELPTDGGYLKLSFDQNYWQNTKDITLGNSLTPTWVNTERISTNQNATLTIVGDVVIDAQRNLNLGGSIDIKPGASLTIMAGENMHVNANYIDQQFPSQFQLIAKNSQDVVLNNFDVFTGVVNAPNSNVRLAGVGGTPKAQFRGAVVAKYIEVTNGVEFYYDVNLGDGATDDSGDYSDGQEEVGELELISWAEISPSKALK